MVSPDDIAAAELLPRPDLAVNRDSTYVRKKEVRIPAAAQSFRVVE